MLSICVLYLRTRFFRSDRTICRGVLVGLFVVAASFNSTPRVAWSASVAPEVLAFYYGWYGNPQLSGEWRHWRNVDPVNQRIENATDFPKYGAYDSHDPTVVDQQAEAAHAAGITGFIASLAGGGATASKIAGCRSSSPLRGNTSSWSPPITKKLRQKTPPAVSQPRSAT